MIVRVFGLIENADKLHGSEAVADRLGMPGKSVVLTRSATFLKG